MLPSAPSAWCLWLMEHVPTFLHPVSPVPLSPLDAAAHRAQLCSPMPVKLLLGAVWSPLHSLAHTAVCNGDTSLCPPM